MDGRGMHTFFCHCEGELGVSGWIEELDFELRSVSRRSRKIVVT
jgi:hypothetical protein